MCARLLPFSLLVLAMACGAPPLPGGDAGFDAGPTASDGGFDLNDVSWLMPLPPTVDAPGLLHLDSEGRGGALLPRALYDALPSLVSGLSNEQLWPTFRVVGARFDPCFPASASGGCIAQLRLVAQPLVASTPGSTSTEDGTLHLFYALSDADLGLARTRLAALRQLAAGATDHQPLDVHPVMKREGLQGAYATALDALLLELCGRQNLSRVAFMKLVQADVAWRFGAFDVTDGALVEDLIPRLDAQLEQGVQEFGTDDFRSGQLQPEAVGDPFPTLLAESELRLTDQRTFDRAVNAGLLIEHPGKSSPKTIDCGSCHTVSRALRNAKKERPFDATQFDNHFEGNPRFDLRRVDQAGDDPRALRAFGYFGDRSALSQRTINESAVVAEQLSR